MYRNFDTMATGVKLFCHFNLTPVTYFVHISTFRADNIFTEKWATVSKFLYIQKLTHVYESIFSKFGADWPKKSVTEYIV